MIQQDVLQNLFQVRRDLENRLMDLTPANDVKKAQQYQDLSRKRDQVFMTINQVLQVAFREVFSPEVDALLKQLAGETASLQKLANTFEEVNNVISKVDAVIKVAQEIVTAAAKVGVV